MPQPLEAPLLSQLRDGDTFAEAVWRLSNVVQRQGKSGPFVTFQLTDSTGTRPAKAWKVSPQQVELLAQSAFIKAWGRVDDAAQYAGQLIIEKFQPLQEVEDAARFEMPLPGDHRAHQSRFFSLVTSVRRAELAALLRYLFRKEADLWARFQNAPAAVSMHHNYRGGLLEHSGEVALLCDKVAGALPGVDRDLLVTAALLHDVGKVEELLCDFDTGTICYSHEGELIGHVVLGAQMIHAAADALPDFPLRLRTELTHLILSHHGEPEWGAAKRPMCAEALILSQCDNLSAKFATCKSCTDAAQETDFARANGWHGQPNTPQNRIYVGRLRELKPAPSPTDEHG